MNLVVTFLVCAFFVLFGSFDGCSAEAAEPVRAREALAVLCPGRVSLAPMFERAARRYRVPGALLVAVVRKESTCDPTAIGRLGELGLGQIKPGTRAARGYNETQLVMPGPNLMATARHLSRRFALCGDWPAALGVYSGRKTCKLGRKSGYARRVMGFLNEVEGAKRS